MVQAYILIGVQSGEERKVGDILTEMKEVKRLNELFGEWDLIILVEVDKVEQLDDFVTAKIRSLPEVRLTSTMVVAR